MFEAVDFDNNMTASSERRSSSIHGISPMSPLNCAPVQMMVRDKALWPASNKGFSVAMWLRLEGLPDAEDGFGKKNKKQVHRTKTFTKTSQSDTSTSKLILTVTLLQNAIFFHFFLI